MKITIVTNIIFCYNNVISWHYLSSRLLIKDQLWMKKKRRTYMVTTYIGLSGKVCIF